MSLPYTPVQFTTLGDAADDAQLIAATDMVGAAAATDVLLLAHGWNNDMKRAQDMFDQLSGHLAKLLSPSAGRILTIIGVLWPSIRWADKDNIAGGGASVLDPGTTLHAAISESVDDRQIAQKLHRAADNLEGSADARENFVAALRSILPAGSDGGEDPIPEAMADGDASELFTAVADAAWLDDDEDDWPVGMALENGSNGAARWFPDPTDARMTGAGLEELSPLIIARLLLNLTTYYTMRDRAGNVGARGIAAWPPGCSAWRPRSGSTWLVTHSAHGSWPVPRRRPARRSAPLPCCREPSAITDSQLTTSAPAGTACSAKPLPATI